MRVEPMSPGTMLLLHLESRHWTQKDLSEVIGRPMQAVSEIIHNKKEITRQTAAQLAAATGTTPEYWLRAQDEHRLWKLEQKEGWFAMLEAIKRRSLGKSKGV